MIKIPNSRDSFEFENNFYLTCDNNRISKLLIQHELFLMSKDIPGEIVECGVFKGTSLIRFATLIELYKKNGYYIDKIVDLSSYENEKKFLEGTGSMVLDRTNKICYAAISERTHNDILNTFCNESGYNPVKFKAFQSHENKRTEIYHTNVMMSVADKFVVICLDSIDNEIEKENVIENIVESGKEIIEISEEQKNRFAGNMLQLIGDNPYLVMSKSAYSSLTESQIRTIEKYCPIIYSSLDTIEACGGGSARCMMAEIFLPKK